MNLIQLSFNSIFREKTDNTFYQLIRYTFVGGIAFVADFSVLVMLTELANLNYLISAGLGFLVGLSINYWLSIKWIFTHRSVEKKHNEFLIFMIIGLIGLLINEISIWFLTEFISFHYTISKILTTIVVYLWNFGVRKYVLFTDREKA